MNAPPWLRERWESIAAKVLVVVAVVVFLKLALYIDRPVVDDALISMAYGKTLFAGGGLRVTRYSAIAEGFSNPTWTLLLGFLEGLHLDAVAIAKPLGLGFAAFSLALVSAWGPIAQRRPYRLEDAVAPLVAATNPSFAYWALGGLENGLLVCLIALYGALLWLPRTRRVAIALGLSGACLVLTRPEAPLYLAGLTLPWLGEWAWRTRLRRVPAREDLVAAIALVGPVVLYLLLRRAYFGSWLPNTYYAKHAWFFAFPKGEDHVLGWRYNTDFFTTIPRFGYAAGAGLVLAFAGLWTVGRSALGAALVCGGMSFFVWFTGSDWMKEYRLLSPMIPSLAYLLTAGASGVRSALERVRNRNVLRRGALGVLAAIVAATGAGIARQHADRWKLAHDQGGDTPRVPGERPTYGADIRKALAPFGMKHPLIGAPDMGYIGLGLRDFEVIDLAGLTDPTVAREYGNVAAMRDFLVNEGPPTMLLVWGPSNNLLAMNDVLGRYRPAPYAGSHRIYAKVDATADDRCPDGKPAALADNASGMQAKIRADLAAGEAVRALARWRCYFTYRADADLPTPGERSALAREAQAAAEAATDRTRALRDYSLCAVVGAASFTPSSSCRMHAETLRQQLFPRPPQRPR